MLSVLINLRHYLRVLRTHFKMAWFICVHYMKGMVNSMYYHHHYPNTCAIVTSYVKKNMFKMLIVFLLQYF